MTISFVLATLLLALTPTSPDSEFSRLQQVLEQYGFKVKIETTPVHGAYGLLDSNTNTIWIHPIVFELGIARPTLAHEAVHAAQKCHGGKELQTLGLDIEPPPITRQYFLRYHNYRRQIEAEAYTVQVQPNNIDLAISLLHKFCK